MVQDEAQKVTSAAPPDLEARCDAVRCQIAKLYELNLRCATSFEHLSIALYHAQKNGLLCDDEFRDLEALNRRANAAKHEGLGLEVAAPLLVASRTAAVDASIPIGNYVGELECAYSRRLRRPLKKNEPRYRYQHRLCNMGDFVAIVCLDALEPPIEFVGDSYRKKQDAKHSAALQAIIYLDASRLSTCTAGSPQPELQAQRLNWAPPQVLPLLSSEPKHQGAAAASGPPGGEGGGVPAAALGAVGAGLVCAGPSVSQAAETGGRPVREEEQLARCLKRLALLQEQAAEAPRAAATATAARAAEVLPELPMDVAAAVVLPVPPMVKAPPELPTDEAAATARRLLQLLQLGAI